MLADETAAKDAVVEKAVAEPGVGSPTATPSMAKVEEALDLSPCIVVRGFPETWREHQVKLIFAVFGGVSAIQLGKDAQGCTARVQLKNPENMPKAAENLNNTQVGDGEFIEECTITCQLHGASSQDAAPTPRSVFVDELEMRCRPDAQPLPGDREVFLQNLPVQECTEEQIRQWLEQYGKLEDVYLLQDACSGILSGNGYVQFATHAEALACVSAHPNAEEADIVAHWSESERAMQKGTSAYGLDVHHAFMQRALDNIQKTTQVRSLRMVSQKQSSKEVQSPDARRLHFVATCTEEGMAELRASLAEALQEFHKRVSARLQTPSKGEEPGVPGAESGRSPAGQQSQQHSQQQSPGAPPSQWQPPWPHANAHVAGRPPGPWPLQPMAQPYGWGYPPQAWPAVPVPGRSYPSSRPGPTMPSTDPSLQERLSHTSESGKGESATQRKDPAQAKIDQGEALIAEAQQLVSSGGPAKKAYERYCKGLQNLLDVMPKLPEDDAAAVALRARVDRYLAEAEVLKTKLDGEGRSGAATSKTPTEPARDETQRSAKRRDLGGPPSPLQARLEKGEALIDEGRVAEDKGQLEDAYKKYCHGLQVVLEVMPQLGDENPRTGPLRTKVASYLERAEGLKERLELASSSRGALPGAAGATAAGGERPGSRPEAAGGVGERLPAAAAARSRSRRHKHRERSRSRSRAARRKHSRSEATATAGKGRRGSSGSRARPVAATAGSSACRNSRAPEASGGSPQATRPAPPKASGSPPEPKFEATRGKSSGAPPRPSGAPTTKSGTALLVGKSKAAVKR